MTQLLALLIFICAVIFSTFSFPSRHMIEATTPDFAKRSTSLAASNNILTAPAVHLNTSTSAPIKIWPIECGEETTPPGWFVPPEMHTVTNPIDCRGAIFRVTRGGDPRDPQFWTSRASWVHGSCGVFLTPGSSHARLNFPRIDMAEIGQEIERKCMTWQHEFIGGWVPIGGSFVVILTGTAAQR